MVIHPEVIVTPDQPTVKFREPKEQVDLEKEIGKVLYAQGWACGTIFNVQFVDHSKKKLLAYAPYIVTEEVENVHINESNPYQPITKVICTRKAQRIGMWWESPETDDEAKLKGTVVWNPGKKLHQVKFGERVVFESDQKDEALKFAEEAAA